MYGERLWIDGHVDWPYYLAARKRDDSLAALRDGPFTLEAAARSGVRLFGTAIYCEDTYNGEPSAAHLEKLFSFTLKRLDGVAVIRNASGLDALKCRPNALGTFLILENADGLGYNHENLERLYRRGLRLVGLTHAGPNRLAQGNGVEHAEGLTAMGRAILDEIGKRGLAVDLAHLHPRCFWEVVDHFEGPLVSTHTGVRECCDIRRNLDLRQAHEILARRGVIGIAFNPELLTLGDHCGLQDIFRHLDLLVQTLGPGAVGLGSDFFGFDVFCRELEHIGHVERLVRMMEDRGYDAAAVQQIMGGNWERFLSELMGRSGS